MFERGVDDEVWIDWNLSVSGAAADTLRVQLTRLVADSYSGKRFHRRKHSQVVGALIANLLKAERAWIRYPRRRDQYYGHDGPRGIGRDVVARTVGYFSEHGLVDEKRGYYDRARGSGAPSLLRASERLIEIFAEAQIYEPIVVDISDNLELLVCRDFPVGTSEPPEAKEWRAQLMDYNDLLAASEVQRFGHAPFRGQYVCRVFNRSWKLGGRFYRGSWQNMPGRRRLRLRINGAQVVELDYGELHLRMLYANEGIDLQGDAYRVDGVERKVMKKTSLVAINAPDLNSARGCLQQEINMGGIPRNYRAPELLAKFSKAHPRLDKYLCQGVGLKLQNRDSELVRQVLHDTTERGILALPVHDSFIVAKQHQKSLRESMRSVYIDSLGFEPKIKVSTPKQEPWN